jgi:hypothetical protein
MEPYPINRDVSVSLAEAAAGSDVLFRPGIVRKKGEGQAGLRRSFSIPHPATHLFQIQPRH